MSRSELSADPPDHPELVAPRGIDWLCIGAALSGSTSLHHLLDTHPEIFVPRAKELPLFHRPVSDEQVRDYMRTNFAEVPLSRRCGTVTPHYLYSVETAGRVHHYLPDILLIAILRDPVGRAVSDYNFRKRMGKEVRSCHAALTQQLDELKQGALADSLDQDNNYVRRGCYGTLLAPWYELYGSDKILVVFTEELARDPDLVLQKVEQHLGIGRHPFDGGFLRHHAHPPQHPLRGVRNSAMNAVRRTGLLKAVPRARKKQIFDLVDKMERRISKIRPEESAELDAALLSDLQAFFTPEVRHVSDLIGRVPPWSLTVSSSSD